MDTSGKESAMDKVQGCVKAEVVWGVVFSVLRKLGFRVCGRNIRKTRSYSLFFLGGGLVWVLVCFTGLNYLYNYFFQFLNV